MINKYYQLIKFLSKVTPDQINSNIYFKKVKEYMDICFKECKKATEELYKTKSYNNKQIELKLESPNYTIDDLPSYINDKVELIEYGIFNNKTRYVDILDWSHRYVYEDYNKFITNSEKLCKIIYILQLNNLLNKELRNFVCSNININNKKFNATITTNKNIENNSKVRKLIK